MKTYIRQRLRESLIENKKTTHTGGNRPAYGGRGDNVYYFNYGDLQDFKTHYNQIKREIFDKLSDKEKEQLFAKDENLEYGDRFRFKVTINSDGGPKIQGLESSAVRNNIGSKVSQTGNVKFFNKSAPIRFKQNFLGKMMRFTLKNGKDVIFKVVGQFGNEKIFFTICDNDNVLSQFFKNNIYVTDLASLSSNIVKTNYVHIKNVSDIKNYTEKMDTWKPYTFKLSKSMDLYSDDGTPRCNLTDVIREFQGLPIPFVPIRDYLAKIDRSPSPHYYAYLHLLYADYNNIIDFVDKGVGYLDDKAANIAKEKTPGELEYKRSKLGRHEKSAKLKKALYGDSEIQAKKEELTNQLTMIKKTINKIAREREPGYKEAIKIYKNVEQKIKDDLNELL